MLVQIIKDSKRQKLLKGMFICMDDEKANKLITKKVAKKC